MSKKLKKHVKIDSLEFLGKGCHGIAYKATATSGETYVLKQFLENGRNMDYFEDRVKEALQIKRTSAELPNHIPIHHLATFNRGELTEFPETDPIIIMDEIKHSNYFSDLSKFKEELTAQQKLRIEKIARYLAHIHSKKRPSELYDRYLKDWFSTGILELTNQLPNNQLTRKKMFLQWEHKLSSKSHRCSLIHGEFFPETIHFTPKNTLKTYDMRRIGAGEPADDVGSMLFNYYAYSLQNHDIVLPVYKHAAKIFLDTYLKRTNDKEILKILPCFMAYRCLILTHPTIVPMENSTRNKFSKLLSTLLKMNTFKYSMFDK